MYIPGKYVFDYAGIYNSRGEWKVFIIHFIKYTSTYKYVRFVQQCGINLVANFIIQLIVI